MINICEVGPRDGLQNERTHLTVTQKVQLITQLVDSGIKKIEAVSFVNPKVIPQMANAEEVMKEVPLHQDVIYAGLILNEFGLERAMKTSIHHLHLTMATSSTFNLKNAKRTVKQSLHELKTVIKSSLQLGYHTVVILGTAFGCPYEGYISPEKVLHLAENFVELGCTEITLADTTGMATPLHVRHLLTLFQKKFNNKIKIGLHVHNTRGLALANCFVGYECGIHHFDTSIGGLGGCPFAPKAVGNVCTEDLVHLFEQMNLSTGINLNKLIKTNEWLEQLIGHPLPGMVAKAGVATFNNPM